MASHGCMLCVIRFEMDHLERFIRQICELDRRRVMEESKEVTKIDSKRTELVGFTESDFNAMSEQLKLLKSFIQKQLVEGVDYGKFGNAPKECLLKPGAEKLQRLFKLGVRFEQTDKVLRPEMGFALYSYKAKIYPLSNPEAVIAECEGSANSKEKNYAKKQISDAINTIQKMGQKRAYIGGIILATGASDYFTHDMEDEEVDTTGSDHTPTKPATPLTPVPTTLKIPVSDAKPSRAQANRMFAIAMKAHWPSNLLASYLKKTYGVTRTDQVPLAQYEACCNYIESHPMQVQDNLIDSDKFPFES